jgi:hypothetical protein
MRWELLLSRVEGGTVESVLWKLSSRADDLRGLSERVLDSDACSWASGPLGESGIGVGVGAEKPWNDILDDGGGSDSGDETWRESSTLCERFFSGVRPVEIGEYDGTSLNHFDDMAENLGIGENNLNLKEPWRQ